MDDPILLSGRVPLGNPEDAARLAAYLVRGDEVLASAPIDEKGGLQVELQKGELEQRSAYGLALVVGPAGFEDHLENVGSLQRVPIERELVEKAKKGRVNLGALEIDLSEARLEIWWRWCWPYEVSGVLLTPDGCPVPGADVTVYSVRHTIFGYARTARATVTTDATGHFTAWFNWCRCFCCCSCWPCWPFWWYCWPWWWERDILHVIESIEQTLAAGGRLREQAPQLTVARPRIEELVRGEAFPASRIDVSPLVQDEERTQLVRRKLSSPAIRELFPWWWWCCDEPNIVFSATQGTVTVLDENPATQTRWCLPSGSFETLVANSSAAGLCGGGTGPAHGFVFEAVGLIDVGDIHDGYAAGAPGSPESDMAFTGSLNIFGQFSSTSGVDYYQIVAGQWIGNPARPGHTAPAGGSVIGPDLYTRALILRADNTWVPPFAVKMGPFDQGGQTNLYATQATRQALAPGAIPLPDLPAMGPGDELFWIDANMVISTAAQALINGNAEGAVTLSVRGYDGAFTPIALASNPDDHLTLEIDTTPITTAHIDTFEAFDAGGNPVQSTTQGDCRAYHLAGGHVALAVTVSDAHGHLADYSLAVDYGHGSAASASPGERSYPLIPIPPPSPYSPPDQAHKAFVGGSETYTYTPPVECCYDFRLNVEKRVTNGYGSPGVYTADFWTASLVP